MFDFDLRLVKQTEAKLFTSELTITQIDWPFISTKRAALIFKKTKFKLLRSFALNYYFTRDCAIFIVLFSDNDPLPKTLNNLYIIFSRGFPKKVMLYVRLLFLFCSLFGASDLPICQKLGI